MPDLRRLALLLRTINPRVVVGNGPDDSAGMRKLHADAAQALEWAAGALGRREEKIAQAHQALGSLSADETPSEAEWIRALDYFADPESFDEDFLPWPRESAKP